MAPPAASSSTPSPLPAKPASPRLPLGPAHASLAVLAVLLPSPIAIAVALRTGVDALAVLSVAAGVLIATAILRRLGLGWRDVGMARPRSLVKTVVAAIGVAFVVLVGTSALAPLVGALTGSPPDLSRFDQLRGNATALATMLLIVWTTAAFGEEMLFRGYVIRCLEGFGRPTRARTAFAVVIASILFGSGHAYQGATGVVLTTVIGLAYSVVYLVGGRNLWAPIVAHGIYDTIGVVVVFLNADRPGH